MRDALDDSFSAHGLNWPTVIRYLSGHATDEEVARVRSWLGDDRNRWQELEFLRVIWNSPMTADTSNQAALNGPEDAIAKFRRREAERKVPENITVRDRQRLVAGRRIAGSGGGALRERRGGLGTRTLPEAPSGDGSPLLNDQVIPALSEIGIRERMASFGQYVGRLGRSQAGLGGGMLRERAFELWGVGGAVVLFCALTFMITRRTSPVTRTTRTYATHSGQTATMTLDDGTQVVLAEKTALRLVGFGAQARFVQLDSGEAHFTVPHASGAPFSVRSGPVTAHVLGTEFLIRYNVDHAHARVAVASGKVRIGIQSLADSSVTLVSGQVGDVADSIVRVNGMDDVPPGTEQAPGHLLFHRARVTQVLQTLSHWYGYEFRCADNTLLNRTVTIGISMESSAAALAAIERVLAVNLQVVGDTITLVPYPTPRARGMPRTRSYDMWTPTEEVGR